MSAYPQCPANFAGHLVVTMKGKNGSLSFGTDWRDDFLPKPDFLAALQETIPTPADLGAGYYHVFRDPGPTPGTTSLGIRECAPGCEARRP